MFNRQHKVRFRLKKSTFIIECALAIAVSVAGGCSSDGKPVKSVNTVPNPITIKVNGIKRQDVRDNVYGYLSSLPQIAKEKSRLYGKEISDKITLAVHSYGYYHPKINLDYPKRDSKSRELVADVDLGKPLFIRNFQIEILGEGAFHSALHTQRERRILILGKQNLSCSMGVSLPLDSYIFQDLNCLFGGL